jgi:glc operon protein GlcG
MNRLAVFSIVTMALLLGADAVQSADQSTPGASALDAIPDKMPFNTPYGPPISLRSAQDVIQAAVAEATRRGWQLNFAVVDSGANMVAFVRMDGAQLASIEIAEHKARTAAKFRRPTRFFEDAVQKQNLNYMLTLDDISAGRGGIPLVDHGKIIGAIGCSGGTGAQDEAVCTAAAATINK